MTSLSELKRLHFRKTVPKEHRVDLDTRVRWMWNQRFGTVQKIYSESSDLLDHTAATLILQCLLERGDLNSIVLLLQRLEGGPQVDEEVRENEPLRV